VKVKFYLPQLFQLGRRTWYERSTDTSHPACTRYEQGQGVEIQDPRRLLAQRLRALREETWPERRITQLEVARALGGVSMALISSWESPTKPRIPPLRRIDSYAVLFATARSFDPSALGPLSPSDLTDEEREVMESLKHELRRLRNQALQQESGNPWITVEVSAAADFWRFEDETAVTIVCARLPQRMLDQIPYTSVDDPDYIELLTYSELDSLFELHGHIRAINPSSAVALRSADTLRPDDYSSHLVVLGGVDWNLATTAVLEHLALPVRQVADWKTDDGQYFEVDHDGMAARHRPVLEKSVEGRVLREDVALFARATNPFNRRRTVTVCSGMYGRGSYGAVRALTDPRFREPNAEYLRSRFGECEAYCILTRVPVVHGATLTPDWTNGEHIIFEWSR